MAPTKEQPSPEPDSSAVDPGESTGQELPKQSEAATTALRKRNAFSELMSSSKKPKESAINITALSKAKSRFQSLDTRNGLGVYIEKPETNPEGLVVEYDEDFVVINDKYPKSSVHLLLIPRKPEYFSQHPLHLLSTDQDFRTEVQTRVTRLKRLAASELRRQFGNSSASDAPYQQALEAMMSSPDGPPTSEDDRAALLPPGRDWLSEVVAGVHTHPSMNHAHIHIFSRDMTSIFLKHKKHYLSFNTTFLVQLDEFPLEENSLRFHPGDWPKWDMICWRCGKNFQNKFSALKAHLAEEFVVWKQE